jgi:hypothetical protein
MQCGGNRERQFRIRVSWERLRIVWFGDVVTD